MQHVLHLLLALAVTGGSPGAAGVQYVSEPIARAAFVADTVPGKVSTGRHTFGDVSRNWRLYEPSIRRADVAPAMLVFLHGCTQDASDLMRGTRAEEFAERAGMIVLAPEQDASAHPQKCWNWYDPRHQNRDAGEVAWLSSVIAMIVKRYDVDASRVHIAGISAGGAMAQLFATAYPEQVASLTVASGVAVGAAATVPDALLAMRNGPREGTTTSSVVLARMGERKRAIPLLVMHGAADSVVSPRNADALVKQWSEVLDVLGVARPRERLKGESGPGKTTHLVAETDAADRAWLVDWRVRGVGHAWSGGAKEGTYTDPDGADATAVLFAFIAEQNAAATSRLP